MYNQLNSNKVYKFVFERVDLGAVDTLEQSILYIAVGVNNISIVKALLECYIDTSIRDKKSNTARSYQNKRSCLTNINSRALILQLLDK